MRPAHYLESLTDSYCPGRFAIKTKPIPKLERSFRKQWEDGQAEAIVTYCTEIHEQSRASLVRAFELLVGELKNGDELANAKGLSDRIFAEIRNACYPYIFIAAADVRAALDVQKKSASPVLLAPRDHMSTIAEPNVLRDFYFEQCRDLLAHGYVLEAGLSVVPMPVTYAIERSAVDKIAARRSILEAIQSLFPVPTLSEVEDSVVDGWYQRREESILIDREYTQLNSVFWEAYKAHLRSGDWGSDLASPDPGAPAGLLRARLLNTRQGLVDTQRVAACDETHTSIVALREGIPPRVPSANKTRPNVVRHAYQMPKPLSYFDALRTHFSLSRLDYYTGTDAKHFQKNVLAINYPEYARQFVLRALVEVYRTGPDQGTKLVVAPERQGEHPGGRVLQYNDVVGLFRTQKDIETNSKGAEDLAAIASLMKDRRAVDRLEASEAYHRCMRKVADLVRSSDAQMPAYHYIASQPREIERKRDKDDEGYRKKIFEALDLPNVTMIDIGVGPSNAKTITDHLAPLRPRCWIMIGRCSGLRAEQHIGDYVFATSYVRRDGVLDKRVPLDAPVKTTRVVMNAFEEAAAYLTNVDGEVARQMEASTGFTSKVLSRISPDKEGLTAAEREEARFHALRQKVRLGTVIATGDRNWETAPNDELLEELNAYRAIALDMEGGVLAANGYRYRVHHGAFLCVSAKPLDGSVRMRQLQNKFFERQMGRHLEISIGALRWLEYNFESALLLQYSRELRAGDDPPWD
jgi:nucleoside phosphorylase